MRMEASRLWRLVGRDDQHCWRMRSYTIGNAVLCCAVLGRGVRHKISSAHLFDKVFLFPSAIPAVHVSPMAQVRKVRFGVRRIGAFDPLLPWAKTLERASGANALKIRGGLRKKHSVAG